MWNTISILQYSLISLYCVRACIHIYMYTYMHIYMSLYIYIFPFSVQRPKPQCLLVVVLHVRRYLIRDRDRERERNELRDRKEKQKHVKTAIIYCQHLNIVISTHVNLSTHVRTSYNNTQISKLAGKAQGELVTWFVFIFGFGQNQLAISVPFQLDPNSPRVRKDKWPVCFSLVGGFSFAGYYQLASRQRLFRVFHFFFFVSFCRAAFRVHVVKYLQKKGKENKRKKLLLTVYQSLY